LPEDSETVSAAALGPLKRHHTNQASNVVDTAQDNTQRLYQSMTATRCTKPRRKRIQALSTGQRTQAERNRPAESKTRLQKPPDHLPEFLS